MSRRIACFCFAVAVLSGASALAWQLEDDLERRLAGSWAIVKTEVYSNCAGAYNNNDVRGAGVTSSADLRFDPGELVKIDKINLKKKRVDLFLSLSEPVLKSRHDGPFELLDEAACKVQLMIGLPRELTKTDDIEGIMGLVAAFIEQETSKASAEQSSAWNRRERRSYPPDYEETLARYAVWKAEQTNAAVLARSAEAHRDLERLTDDIRSDEEYLAGFAAGVEDLRYWDETDCDRMVDLRVTSVGSSPPSDETRSFKDGYEDGQSLVVNLQLVAHLEHCLVPVPALP